MGDTNGTINMALEGDDLDRFELSLAGYLSPSELNFLPLGQAVECVDSEGTPIGIWDGAMLHPLRPLARGIGPAWRQEYRRSARELTDSVAARWMLPFSRPLSIEEIELAIKRALSAGNGGHPNMLLITPLASRTPAAAGEFNANTLVEVAEEIQTFVQERSPEVACDILVLPWPRSHPPAIENIAMRARASIASPGLLRPPPSEGATYLTRSRIAIAQSMAQLDHRGAVVLFTGLSGSGKSTIARGLAESLGDQHARVVLLDGDQFRRTLAPQLGFDRASRNRNIMNIANAALEAARTGAIAIAAPIAPFAESRSAARRLVSAEVPFYLVHVSTPLEVCERRDRKGLYAKARRGEIADFTGISSPYEDPTDADLTIDASIESTSTSVSRILRLLIPD
jgi:sulfate adenylyltransferase